MPEAPQHDRPTVPPSRWRWIAVAASLGVIAGGLILARPGSDDSSDTTAAASSSSTAVTTASQAPPPTAPASTVPSLPPLVAEFSPFVNDSIVSRTNPIPNSPHIPEAAEVYVDPVGGDDAGAGTRAAPVASLEAAQTIARRLLKPGSGDVVVYLRGGVHQRDRTFTIDFQDSGRGGHDMVYRSYPGEQAILDGGVPITGWQPTTGSIVVASVPERIESMRQFFADGKRQPRARSATALGTADEFITGELFGRQRNVAMAVDSELVAGLARPEDLELVYVGVAIAGHGVLSSNGEERLRPSWKAHRLPVTAATAIGDGTTRLDIGAGALYHASERGYEPLALLPTDPFYLENALELLDEPGEWYFHPIERQIYWWPPSEAALADAWAPTTETLLNVDGTPRRPVRNVRFEGIVFRHAAYTVPNKEGYTVSQAANWFTGWRPAEWMEVDGARHPYLDGVRFPGLPGAAVEMDSARDITFRSNVFTALGAVGVMLHNDVRRVVLDGNLFVDISAAALVAGHPVHDVIDQPMEGPISLLTFTNNVVDRAAAEFTASVGVQLTKVAGADVSHNLFRDLPYSALSLGWGWNTNPSSDVHRAITVESNYFENVVNTLYDGAPIYLLGPVAEPGAARSDYVQIRRNFANNAGAGDQFKAPSDSVEPGFTKRPGVQLDEGSRNVLINDNVFAGSTVWLQVTGWHAHGREPGWADSLALIGGRNWSDTADSVPRDLSLIGVSPARLFSASEIPTAAREIMLAAGLEPGVAMPPLP